MLNPPFSLQASQAGLRGMGRVFRRDFSSGNPYQATSKRVALRTWVDANGGRLLARYLAGYIEGVRWALTPANREAACGIIGPAGRGYRPTWRRARMPR